MRNFTSHVLLFLVSLCFVAPGQMLAHKPWSKFPSKSFDVVIVGGSSSGVGAAIGAARLGVRVALVDDTPVLGGMLANGIGNVDSMAGQATSGIFRQFTNAVKAYYAPIMKTDPLFKEHPKPYLPPALTGKRELAVPKSGNLTTSGDMSPDEGGRWEPHVAAAIFKEMVAKYPNITVYYKRHVVNVIKDNNRVIGVVTYENTKPNAYAPSKPGTALVLYGSAIVDATVEGDIATWAGIPYRVGREPRSRLEPHAGSIYFFDLTGEILPGSTGAQDRGVVSYGLRITLKHYDEQHYKTHVLKDPPPGYERADYEHSTYAPREYNPNGKAEVNEYPFGSEIQELNWKWPEATRAVRERMYQVYKNHALGFLYYLQHVKGYTHWGLPTNDYTDNGNVPYRIYVREARRMVGRYTMTEADISPFVTQASLIQPVKENSIAVGYYPIDCKPSYRKTNLSMPDKGNGDFYLANVAEPFQIPYGAIIPEHVNGIIFPTALSATHVAFCAIRLDPTWTVVGQAAGIAAALSAKEGVELRAVSVPKIQRQLLKQKAELMFYWDLPLDSPAFRAVDWLSVKKVVNGYPDRLFSPTQPLTRAEMAAMLVRGLKVWPSVSNVHFSDVPKTYWAFRYIETLYDKQALGAFGIKPLWPRFGGWDKLGNHASDYAQKDGFEPFHPAQAVTWVQFIATIHSLQMRRSHSPASEGSVAEVPALSDPMQWAHDILSRSMFGAAYAKKHFSSGQPITRGEACGLLASLLDTNASR